MNETNRTERPAVRKMLTRAALIAAVGAATVALPLATTASAMEPASGSALARPGERRGMPQGDAIEAVTDRLGLAPRQVGERLRDGESLAEIAAAEGVGDEELTATIEDAVGDVLDRGVEEGRLTATQRDAFEKIVTVRVGGLIERSPADLRDGQRRTRPPAVVEEVADLLGLEPRQVVERVRGGETLAEVADAEGVTEADLVAVIEEGALAKLSEIAAPADLSRAEEEALEEFVGERVEQVVEMEPGEWPGARGGRER